MFDALPWRLEKRAAIYHQLSTCFDAGLPVADTLALTLSSVEGRDGAEALARSVCSGGAGLATALSHSRLAPPPIEGAVLRTAEEVGRLPEAFEFLADGLQTRARSVRAHLPRLLYALGILHLCPVVLAISKLITDPASFAVDVVVSWAAIWFVGAAVLGAFRWGVRRRPTALLFARLPVLGAYLTARHWEIALTSLLWSYGAGTKLIEAIESVLEFSPPSRCANDLVSARDVLRSGETIEFAFGRLDSLELLLRQQLVTHAVSGDLELALKRVTNSLREGTDRRLASLLSATASSLYIAAMVGVAWTAIQFYSGYYGQLKLH